MQTHYSYVFCCCFFVIMIVQLRILPSFPELVCSAVIIVNIKKKIRATGAQTPHSINKPTTLPSTVFFHVCNVYNICTKEASMSLLKDLTFEKTVDFTLEKFKYYLEIKFSSECIGRPTLMNNNNDKMLTNN